MVRKKSVFVVHKYETADNKHHVHFGSDFNNPKNTRRFTDWNTALRFAKKKAVEQGNSTILVDSPSGARDIAVSTKKPSTRKPKAKKPRAKKNPWEFPNVPMF